MLSWVINSPFASTESIRAAHIHVAEGAQNVALVSRDVLEKREKDKT